MKRYRMIGRFYDLDLDLEKYANRVFSCLKERAVDLH